jgi:hypothetical protein
MTTAAAVELPPLRVYRGARRRAYLEARSGVLPAEALTQEQRWRLVAELHRAGWTDREIAEHTFMTTYTAARIREGMHLAPNQPSPGLAPAADHARTAMGETP